MDHASFILLIINAALYLILFIVYTKKKKTFDIGSIILLCWIIGSMGSVYYYTFEVSYLSYDNIKLIPLLYLFLVNLMMFYPFLKTDYSKITVIDTYNLKSVLRIISIFFSIIGLPILVNLILRLSSFSLLGSMLADMYNFDEDKASIIFFPIIKPLYSIIRHFTNFVIFLFFYNLTLAKRNKFIIIGLGICIFGFFLTNLLSGSRGGILTTLLTCGFYAIFMKYAYTKKIYKKLYKLAIFAVGLIIIGVAAISISRISDMSQQKGRDLLMDQWISQYAGEGIIRFDNTIWHSDTKLKGYQCLPYIYSFFDPRVKNLDEEMNFLEGKVKYPLTVFYTYVGDFVIDFGIIGAVLILFIIQRIINYLIKRKRNKISMYHLIILSYAFTLITVGFTANLYRTYYTQIQIVETLIFLGILYLFQILNRKINKNATRNSNPRLQGNLS